MTSTRKSSLSPFVSLAEHGDKALELMQKACITADIQRRCRQAVRHTILTNEWRARAMNRWLDT